MSKPKTLVFAMRDVAPANHYAPVLNRLRGNPNFKIHVFAQKPAIDILAASGIEAMEIPADGMAAYCRDNILGLKPDLLLLGHSTTHDSIGIDEVLLHNAPNTVLIMQDWPGAISAAARRDRPHRFLCTGIEGAELTRRAGFTAHMVGAPAYDVYADKDYDALRKTFRDNLPASARGKSLVAFSGQYLKEHEGYLALVEALARSLAARNDVHLVYRPHPREKTRGMGDVETTSEIFERYLPGVWSLDENAAQDHVLAGADVTLSYCSTSLKDLAMMNLHSAVPVGVPVAMMWDTDLNRRLDVERYPWLDGGLGYVVTRQGDFDTALAGALRPQTREAVWQAAKENAGASVSAADNVVRVIYETLEGAFRPKLAQASQLSKKPAPRMS